MCYTGIEPGPAELGYPIDIKGGMGVVSTLDHQRPFLADYCSLDAVVEYKHRILKVQNTNTI
jgi:hypothetical protein